MARITVTLKCQVKNLNSYENHQGKLGHVTSSKPNELVAVDIMGPLESKKHSYILIIMDVFSKFSCFVPLKDITSRTVIKKIASRHIRIFGPPKTLLSDNGALFRSNEFKLFSVKYGIKKKFTTPYHPQCNGLVERQNRSVKNYIKSALGPYHNNWSDLLHDLQLRYNSSVHIPLQR